MAPCIDKSALIGSKSEMAPTHVSGELLVNYRNLSREGDLFFGRSDTGALNLRHRGSKTVSKFYGRIFKI